MTRVIVLMLIALLAASSLGACGRKGAPEAPPGTTYPSQYPYK